MAKDPYQVLGVSRDMSQTDIRRAYSAIAKRYHPDRNPGDAVSLERFVEATEAYEALSDPVRRQGLDASLERTQDIAAMEFDKWGAPTWEMPSGTNNKRDALGDEPWENEPPYGAILAVVALIGIAVMIFTALFFM